MAAYDAYSAYSHMTPHFYGGYPGTMLTAAGISASGNQHSYPVTTQHQAGNQSAGALSMAAAMMGTPGISPYGMGIPGVGIYAQKHTMTGENFNFYNLFSFKKFR